MRARDLRATDRDRNRAVSRLRGAYIAGALSTDTFESRAFAAYQGQTGRQLDRLVDDLPSPWDWLKRAGEALLASLAGAPPPPCDVRDVDLPQTPGQRIWLGREPDCEVRLADRTISRRHLKIEYDGVAWRASDSASTNGTFASDGRRIEAIQVMPGDLLWLGNLPVRLVHPPAEDRA